MKIIFDIGGTNIRISSVDGEKFGEVLRTLTPANPEEAKKLLKESIDKISGGQKIDSITGGIPGIMGEGIIKSAPNLSGWIGFDLKSFLQENFCQDVFIYNDASLAALGESVYGAGKGKEIVGYIGIGTGIGGAKVVKGEIDKTKFGFEPGHHIIDLTSGQSFEGLVSGVAIFHKYGLPAEKVGREELKKLVPKLAVGIYNAIVFWSPDVLVVGGSLMDEDTAYKIEDIKQAIQAIQTPIPILSEIRRAELGDLSGLYGALVLAQER